MSRGVNLTVAQVQKLLRNARTIKASRMHVPVPIAKVVEELTYEADIENTFCRGMEMDGWRVLKYEQNFSERKKKTTGEAGAADRLFIRYIGSKTFRGHFLPPDAPARVLTESLWIEFKRNRHRRKDQKHQKTWQQRERERGALVWSAGEDFEMNLAGAALHYLESGLCGRREVFLAMVPPEGRPPQ